MAALHPEMAIMTEAQKGAHAGTTLAERHAA